jgi:subtilisin family serine protease
MSFLLLLLVSGALDLEGGEPPRAGEGESEVWVYFTDKGEAQGSALSSELLRAEADLLPAARERRQKSMSGSLVDERDVPVYSPYVEKLVEKGARLRHRSRWLNAVSLVARDEIISAIARLPFVKKVTPLVRLARSGPRTILPQGAREKMVADLPLGIHHAQGDTAFYGEAFYQLAEIGVPAVHDSGYTGAGVLVGMFDTGFYQVHQSLRDQAVIAERDFIFGDGETQNEAGDDPGQHEHGTVTWSVLGGYAPSILIGPAYGASFFLAKTEDTRSETPVEEDNYVAALEWADSLGVSVVSASLAYRDFDDPLYDYEWEDIDGNTATITVAVDIAASRGILVANAMGNSGYEGPGSLWTPADADSMLAVGAVDAGNVVADFSSRGPTFDDRIKPEVVARGVDTYCAFSYSPYSYGSAGGTSLSTPLVGGAAALVMEAHPEWGAMEVRDALMQTADNQATPDNDRGWGRIDVRAAIYDVSPPIFPVPFSLLSPGDGDSLDVSHIDFVWGASRDPDAGGPVSYTLLIARDQGLSDIVLETSTAETTLALEGGLAADSTYYWGVQASDQDTRERWAREVWSFSTALPSSIGPGDELPRTWTGLFQNSPNPFNPSTIIAFSVGGERRARVKLEIFDVRGRRVRILKDGPAGPGVHRLTWDGRDGAGRSAGSGIYLYRLSVDGVSVTRKMNLQK